MEHTAPRRRCLTRSDVSLDGLGIVKADVFRFLVMTRHMADARVVEYDMNAPYPGSEEISLFGQTPFRLGLMDLIQMSKDAVPWPHYLARRYNNMTIRRAVAELQSIVITPEQLQYCLSRLPDSQTTALLREQAEPFHFSRQGKVGRYDVFDEPSGFYRKTGRQRSPSPISDARCFIDHVFYDPHRKRKIYRGRILHCGQTLRFDVPVGIFDRRPIETVRTFIRHAERLYARSLQ